MHYIVCTAESKESWHLTENKLWTKRKQRINEHIWTLQYFSLGLPFGAPFYWLRREETFLRGHTITSLSSCRLLTLEPFLCFTSPFLSHSLSPEQQQQQTQHSWLQLTHLHRSANMCICPWKPFLFVAPLCLFVIPDFELRICEVFRCAFYTTLADYCKTHWKWSQPQCKFRLKAKRTTSTGENINLFQILIAWLIQGSL